MGLAEGAVPTAVERSARPNCGGVAGPGPHSRRGCCREPWASRAEPSQPTAPTPQSFRPQTRGTESGKKSVLFGVRLAWDQALDLCRRKASPRRKPGGG